MSSRNNKIREEGFDAYPSRENPYAGNSPHLETLWWEGYEQAKVEELREQQESEAISSANVRHDWTDPEEDLFVSIRQIQKFLDHKYC